MFIRVDGRDIWAEGFEDLVDIVREECGDDLYQALLDSVQDEINKVGINYSADYVKEQEMIAESYLHQIQEIEEVAEYLLKQTARKSWNKIQIRITLEHLKELASDY